MRVIGSWLALLVVTFAAAPAATAGAFAWDVPPECPGEAEVLRRVEQRLGGPLERAAHGIEIAITREEAILVATIDARALVVANELRTLRAAGCDGLTDAIAVVVARIAGEVRAHVEQIRRDSRDEPSAARRRRSSLSSYVTPWGGGARVLGVSGVGALPRVNVGGEVAGYVRHRTTFVELALARWIPEAGGFQAGAPPGSLGLDVATVRVGWRPETVPLRAWLAGELGTLSRADLVETTTRRWTALGAGFAVAWPMAPNARLVGSVELAVPLERGEITRMMPPAPEPYRPGVAAARCAFGLEVGWP